MKDGVVGIDLGGTCTKFGLVTRKGRLLVSGSIPTNSAIPYKVFLKKLYDQIEKLRVSLDEEVDLKGIGVGAPNGNCFSGTIDNASNLDWPKEVPVTELLSLYSNLPTVMTNDANAAAVGEMLYGAAEGMKNFISITLGTGLGCGIVANGKLLTGHTGHAGEIGHIVVFHDGRPCGCGRKGCLETYVSAPGLVTTVQQLMEKKETVSKLREVNPADLDAKKITGAAQEGDLLALEAFENTGRIFGMKLADIVAFINPEAIIVSGGLAKAGIFILNPAQKYMGKHLLSIYKNRTIILPSSLKEENVAILGAAAFMWRRLDNNMSEIMGNRQNF